MGKKWRNARRIEDRLRKSANMVNGIAGVPDMPENLYFIAAEEMDRLIRKVESLKAKLKEKEQNEAEPMVLEAACRLVENKCRSLGRGCQVFFEADGVSVAPVSWPGDSYGVTLYSSLMEADLLDGN